jgi:catechol-2,3-dioxygenase
VLGAEVVMRNEFIAFCTYDDEHHRIAFVVDPRINAAGFDPTHPGLEHLAFTYADIDALIATYERLRDEGVTPYWTVNHGPTTSCYYRDPDGNQVELQIDNFPDSASLHAWFRSGAFERNPIGVDIDFEKLIARRRDGEPLEALLRRGDE